MLGTIKGSSMTIAIITQPGNGASHDEWQRLFKEASQFDKALMVASLMEDFADGRVELEIIVT